MKRYFFVCLLLIGGEIVIAQKKLIDSTTFDGWPLLSKPAISDNGKYVVYTIERIPIESHTLVVEATDNNWKKEIIGGRYPRFTGDSKWLVYNSKEDSLCLVELGSETLQCYSNVQKYELVSFGKRQWIVVRQKLNGNSQLMIRDLISETNKVFPGVIDFALSQNGKSLIIEREDELTQERLIEWINTETSQSRVVFKIESQMQAENFAMDTEGKQLIFLTSKQNQKSVWYYNTGMELAVEKLNSFTPGMPKGVTISNAKFSSDGNRLFFEAKETINKTKERSGVMVDIWSYTDDKLQAQQLNEVNASTYYKGVVNLDKNEAIIIQGENEQLYENRGGSDYSLLTTKPCFFEENNWRLSCRVPLYLVNTKDGTRRLIKDSMVFSNVNGVSPDSKYVLYYDPQKQAFFSYSIKDGKTLNITQNIPFPICDIPHARVDLPRPYSPLPRYWLPGKGVVINDEYDLWLLDPAGINAPLCITQGYGRAKGIRFQIISAENLITQSHIILLAFRPSDKANGFYSLNLAKPTNPELLTMGSYLYSWYVGGQSPIKAKSSNTWMVRRESESEFPNYFATKDFKSFVRLSNLQPQKNYNWLTAELHEWTTFDGKKLQGILYKPENFDSSKKYPVVFNFYEEKSDELHQYILPEATGSHINIPHFVSNGYLVFVPDIHYSIGETVESIYSSVASAAQYLSKYNWINSEKMGLQGHSFGGYEVNSLISRTNMFAAAASAAGASDLVSNTCSIDSRNGYSLAYLAELSTYRMGGTIWEKKSAYIENSPVFNADRINTPLLMFNCKGDGVVPFGQGVELFLALRRMNKPAWMLQYDEGGHQLDGKDAQDYTIRLMQFFNHYLKSAPAPIWMSRGIPARLKGIQTGYELDPNGSCGKDCKICKYWNEKMKKDSVACWKEIEERKVREHWE